MELVYETSKGIKFGPWYSISDITLLMQKLRMGDGLDNAELRRLQAVLVQSMSDLELLYGKDAVSLILPSMRADLREIENALYLRGRHEYWRGEDDEIYEKAPV